MDEVELPVEPHGPARHALRGVCGFLEWPDGQVWAHGSKRGMVLPSGVIRRVDARKVEELYRSVGPFLADKAVEPPFTSGQLLPGSDGKLVAESLEHL